MEAREPPASREGGPEDEVARLAQFELFADFDEGTIASILGRSKQREYTSGEQICAEGQGASFKIFLPSKPA